MAFVKNNVIFISALILVSCLMFYHLHSSTHGGKNSYLRAATGSHGRLYHNATKQPLLFSKPGLALYIYRAFRDDRLTDGDVIRIFGLDRYNQHAIANDFVCLWENSDGRDIEVPAEKYYIDESWPRWSPYFAFEVDCKLPKLPKLKTIRLVSEANGCDFELLIEESAKVSAKHDLAVCVKPQMGKLEVSRFVEWFELQRMTGVRHFIIYNSDLRGASRFVVQYYVDRGIATLVDFPFLQAVDRKIEPPELTSQERYALYQQVFLVAYHDCLYRFYKSFKLIEFIDIDEVMLPSFDEPWLRTLERLISMKPTAAGFKFLKAWHFEESMTDATLNKSPSSVPEYLYMQRYVAATEPINNQPQSVVVTDKAVTVSFHGVVKALKHDSIDQYVPWKDFGSVHHFIGKCSANFEEHHCRKLMAGNVPDPAVTRYRVGVRHRVRRVLEFLQLSRL